MIFLVADTAGEMRELGLTEYAISPKGEIKTL